MGKEKIEKPEEFHGQHVFTAAAGVIKLLMIAYLLNAAVYSIGALITLGGVLKHPSFGFGTAFSIFRAVKSPMVYFYIASQLRETYEQFQKILTAKAIDHDSVVKGLASLTNGLQKIKTPLFIGAVMHLIQYWGEIFGEV